VVFGVAEERVLADVSVDPILAGDVADPVTALIAVDITAGECGGADFLVGV
jgi:hypothetical protein